MPYLSDGLGSRKLLKSPGMKCLYVLKNLPENLDDNTHECVNVGHVRAKNNSKLG